MRYQHDSIGEIDVPDAVYYGAQTARAMTNFPISGIPISHHVHLPRGFAMVEIAAVRANMKLQKLDPENRRI
jgi:aspartate ammonia-lyase